jgi:AcrR family transcriptional regulator
VASIGRPREFDVDKALDAAMVVFWRQGYDATTLSDLCTAMGINRPALYSAFDNKRELFVRSIQRYATVDAAPIFGCLDQPTAWDVTEQYLVRSVKVLTNPKRPLGCFYLQTALVASDANVDIAEMMASHRKEHERLLAARYRQAKRDGDLAAGENPVALSRFVSTFRHGVAVQACTGVPAKDLLEAVHRMLTPMRNTTFLQMQKA